MPTVWFALKRSLHCNSKPSEVHDPKARRQQQIGSIFTRKTGRARARCGCSKSIANLRDVIHGSKRHLEKPPSCSPRSIGSSEFLNPITHEVILSNSRSELRISSAFGACHEGEAGLNSPRGASSHLHGAGETPRLSSEERDQLKSSAALTCHKCGEKFVKWEILEAHYSSKHAVSELAEGDSSRKIVEIICRTSWSKTEQGSGRIERVLKVHNMHRTLAQFEDYREMVKTKASKLPKKHSRCLADGNELLRFHGTTIACSLGVHGASSLCTSEKCSVCQIIRHGFSAKLKESEGVFTASTSGRALESIEICEGADDPGLTKALLVCRVIAGRVHKPLDNYQELVGQSEFDSVAGKVGLCASIEELYLLNPRALLPCFVVICKP